VSEESETFLKCQLHESEAFIKALGVEGLPGVRCQVPSAARPATRHPPTKIEETVTVDRFWSPHTTCVSERLGVDIHICGHGQQGQQCQLHSHAVMTEGHGGSRRCSLRSPRDYTQGES
jgi:hypothetical protein